MAVNPRQAEHAITKEAQASSAIDHSRIGLSVAETAAIDRSSRGPVLLCFFPVDYLVAGGYRVWRYQQF